MADSQRKTANLFDVSQLSLRDGYAINDNGVEIESQYTGYTLNHISCEQETQYVLSYLVSSINNGYYRVYFYDEDNNFISRTSSYIPTTMPFEMHITTPSNATSFAIQYAYGGVTNNWNDLMISSGSTALPYEPYGWLHSLRKLTTATEAVENPLYSDGTAITAYTIKGNTVQNGTPTPSNPAEVNGVGVMTENLLDYSTFANGYTLEFSSGLPVPYGGSEGRTATITPIDVSNLSEVTFNYSSAVTSTLFIYSLFNGNTLVTRVAGNTTESVIDVSSGDKLYLCFYSSTGAGVTTSDVSNAMLNSGSTAKPFEPYGYKIPISSGGVTTNIYLGSTQTVRQIKKLVLDGTENWSESDKIGGYRFILGIQSALQSDTTIGAKSYCSHFKLVGTGQTYTLNNAYTITANSEIIMTLGETERLADFKTYLADQYTAGTPVTAWYVLATPETATVNEPLMKIGTYADTLSNATAIPTTDGANSITVDTTVQPSEFTATWTGWHDTSVKEAKHGNNLFDYRTMAISAENSYLNADGSTGSSTDWNITDYIPCNGTNFTVGNVGGNTPAICLYNANKEYITGKSYNTGGTYSKQAVNITSQTTAKFIRFSYCKGSLNPDDISAIMLNSGSTLMPYEPYGIHWE